MFLDVHAPIVDLRITNTVVQENLTLTPGLASETGDAAPDFQSNARDPVANSECGEWDVRTILEKVNARREIRSEHGNGV